MAATPEKLRNIAEELRNTAQYFNIGQEKVASAQPEPKELDTQHVYNFIKFFGANYGQ